MPASPQVAEGFRRAMRQLSTGVVMVTTRVDGQAWGSTVSACCSISLDPCFFLISVGAHTVTAVGLRTDSRFGVSILGERLLKVAQLGSMKQSPKFVSSFCLASDELTEPSVSPVLDACVAHLDCQVVREIEAGDHVIFLGEVERVVLFESDSPLVYFDGGYHRLGGHVDLTDARLKVDTVDSMLYPHPIPLDFRAAPM